MINCPVLHKDNPRRSLLMYISDLKWLTSGNGGLVSCSFSNNSFLLYCILIYLFQIKSNEYS